MKWFAGFFSFFLILLCWVQAAAFRDAQMLVASGLFAIAVQLWKE